MSYRRTSITLAVLCGALASLALIAVPAQAFEVHNLVNSIAVPNSGTPLELAINQSTGKVYATIDNAGVVDVFEASGAPDPTHPQLTEADGTTTHNFALPYGIAVDNTVAGLDRGDIYVADYSAAAVLQFDPSGARTAQAPITAADIPVAGTAQSGSLPAVVNNGGLTPTGVTVAPNGDVYVSDQSNNVVDIFEPSGAFVAQIGATHLGGPYGLALDSQENLYVAVYGAGVIEFASSGVCVNSCTPIGHSSLGVATDSEDNVYSDDTNSVKEFNSSAEPLDSFGAFSFGRAIAINDSSNQIYVADEPARQIDVFEQVNLNLPTISSTTASALTPTASTLSAQINPEFGRTVYRFQYGTTASYGSSTLISEPIGFDGAAHAVSTGITGLTPATTYHFRAVAINFAGTTHGPDQTFTTPDQPAVSGASASSVTSSTATLAAQVNPELAATTYHFQYGTGASYGSSTPESPSIGTDGVAHSVSVGLAGLAPATTYHFRAVATNAFGAATGPDQTFTTAAAPVANPSPKKCKKGLVKQHGKCVKKAHRKLHKQHHKRSGAHA